MKIIPRKFQEGGAVETPQEAPVDQEATNQPVAEESQPAGQEDPMMQVIQMFAEGLQKQDCQLLAQGAQMFLQLVQQSQQGGAAPQEEQGQPVFKKGGILVRRIKK